MACFGEVDRVSDLDFALGSRHSRRILTAVLGQGPLRFNHLKTALGDATGKTLSWTLKRLVADGLLRRKEGLIGRAVTVTYSLTERGKRLAELASKAEAEAVAR